VAAFQDAQAKTYDQHTVMCRVAGAVKRFEQDGRFGMAEQLRILYERLEHNFMRAQQLPHIRAMGEGAWPSVMNALRAEGALAGWALVPVHFFHNLICIMRHARCSQTQRKTAAKHARRVREAREYDMLASSTRV
jgi:hypothetical protein